jgi:hypothetical protein
MELRRSEKDWNKYLDPHNPPDYILVAEGETDLIPLTILKGDMEYLRERFLHFKHRPEKLYAREHYWRFLFLGIRKNSLTAIWQMESPEFLRFWAHLFGASSSSVALKEPTERHNDRIEVPVIHLANTQIQ